MINRIYKLIPKSDRGRLIKILLSVIIRSLLDFSGLAALLPIIIMVLGNHPDKKLFLIYCGAAVLFILLKNVLRLILASYQSNYLMKLYKQFSCRLFDDYYHRGLLFLKSQSTVQLGHEVNFVCYAFSLNVLSSVFAIAGESILLLMMIVALIIWKPCISIMLLLTFIPVILIYVQFVRKRMQLYGKEEADARRRQSRTVTETFRGYAELEINDAYPSSFLSFVVNMDVIRENRLRNLRIGMFPDFLLEVVMVVCLALLMIFTDGNLKITSGVFALFAFRLLPSLRTILSSWSALQGSSYCIDILENGLKPIPDKGPDINDVTLTFRDSLKADHITFAFPDGNVVLNDFSCIIRKGEYVGIRGVSGSGKSTLFNLLLGFYLPSQGQILIDGTGLSQDNLKSWHRLIGYVPQEIFIIQGSFAENIALGSPEVDEDRVYKVLRQVQLDDWVTQLPEGIHTSPGEFGNRMSGGQKQRLGIARALYKGATILFLDEATSSLDSMTEENINRSLAMLSAEQSELTIIVIAHRQSSLMFCNRIIDL